MDVFVKRRDGVEHLYILAENLQYFLGRLDEPDKINLDNLHKASKAIDKNFEKILLKYLKDIQEYAKYMPEDQWDRYMTIRLDSINAMLKKIRR